MRWKKRPHKMMNETSSPMKVKEPPPKCFPIATAYRTEMLQSYISCSSSKANALPA